MDIEEKEFEVWELIRLFQEKKIKEGAKIKLIDKDEILYIRIRDNKYFYLVRDLKDEHCAGLNLEYAIVHNYKFAIENQ